LDVIKDDREEALHPGGDGLHFPETSVEVNMLVEGLNWETIIRGRGVVDGC